MVAIVGASGAGKSTLLHVLGALDRPTRGYVLIGGESINDRTRRRACAELRNRKVGFVFQFHHLLREFSALENVMMPLRIAGTAMPKARSRAAELLARVGLSGRMHHRPERAVGRRAAAHGGGARAGGGSGGPARRRAVGQSRSRERRAAARRCSRSSRATSRSGWSS